MSGWELPAVLAGLSVAAKDVLTRVLGPTADEVGGDLLERYRAMKVRNLTAVVEQAAEIQEKRGAPAQPVPLRVLGPILEGASNEDEADLQRMWAGLLATVSTNPDDFRHAFVHALRSLRPIDAQALNLMFEHLKEQVQMGDQSHLHLLKSEARNKLGIAQGEMDLVYDNLTQLRLVRDSEPLWFTALGEELLRVCRTEE